MTRTVQAVGRGVAVAVSIFIAAVVLPPLWTAVGITNVPHYPTEVAALIALIFGGIVAFAWWADPR